jgi:inner membrane protein involved in colicin E2 resistance
MTTPTQVAHPWRTTVRTGFQAIVSLAAVYPIAVAQLHVPDSAALAGSVAVMAAVTRVMALDAVNQWLRVYVPWLAAQPGLPVIDEDAGAS